MTSLLPVSAIIASVDSSHRGLWIDSRIANTQKICDFTDWSDPGLDLIIRRHLRTFPNHQRRQWEFAMIFLSLARAGMLRPDANAISFGSGTEVLIYTISQLINKLIATDLYRMNSRWVGVRTTSPRDHILAKAKFPVDAAKIDARDMDMREVDYPDNSFDFCWSTGSFEHIGGDKDFIRHLCEVHRVLKEDGVYAFTTVACFEKDSSRIPGNHYFSVKHLLDLIEASPLRPAPVLDCGLTPIRMNKPMLDQMEGLGFRAGNLFTPVVTILRRGLVTSAIHLVLRKQSALPKVRPQVTGLEGTRRFIDRSLTISTRRMWQGWQYLDAFAGMGNRKLGLDQPDPAGRVGFRTQPQYFGKATVSVRVHVDASDLRGKPATVRLKVVSQNNVWPMKHRTIFKKPFATRDRQCIEFTFDAAADKCYSIHGEVARNRATCRAAAIFASITGGTPD